MSAFVHVTSPPERTCDKREFMASSPSVTVGKAEENSGQADEWDIDEFVTAPEDSPEAKQISARPRLKVHKTAKTQNDLDLQKALPATLNTQLPGDRKVTDHLDASRCESNVSSILSTPSSLSSCRPSMSMSTAACALDSNLMGSTRVSEHDESFVNAYNMLTGIRAAVSRINAKNMRPLTPNDFLSTEELHFDGRGTAQSISTRYSFKFKDYAPWVFRAMRDEIFHLDPADYLMSLTAKYIVSEVGSPGKSGSFFYYSRDYRFIIKTIHHSEHRRLRKLLKQYYDHVKANPDTLISQFYGLHRVTLPFGRRLHFLVMNNVFPALYEIHMRYDLKGSTLGRTARQNPQKLFVVYKDLDWIEKNERLRLGPQKRKVLLEQMKKDVRFFQRCNVMDYSFLIGVHDFSKGNKALEAIRQLGSLTPDESQSGSSYKVSLNSDSDDYGNVSRRENEDFASLHDLLSSKDPKELEQLQLVDTPLQHSFFNQDLGGIRATDEDDQPLDTIYFMGIIDFLTYYSARKRLETESKGLLHRKDRAGLSAIPAYEYGERFLKFMNSIVGDKPPEKPVKDKRARSTR